MNQQEDSKYPDLLGYTLCKRCKTFYHLESKPEECPCVLWRMKPEDFGKIEEYIGKGESNF